MYYSVEVSLDVAGSSAHAVYGPVVFSNLCLPVAFFLCRVRDTEKKEKEKQLSTKLNRVSLRYPRGGNIYVLLVENAERRYR